MEQNSQVPEYQKLMEQAPQIHASGLEGDYRTLAEFNCQGQFKIVRKRRVSLSKKLDKELERGKPLERPHG